MQIAPMAAKMLMIGILSMIWLSALHRARSINPADSFYRASEERDRRLAKFYSSSVWIGIAAAFLSFLGTDAFDYVTFDSHGQRELILSLTRGVGVAGLLVSGAVWSQISKRASELKFDGRTLQPVPPSRPDDGSRHSE